MRVVMLAAPGAGKGTQAVRIAERFGARHLSTGEMLRRAIARDDPLGVRVRGYVEKGDLVPDDLLIDVLREPLVEAARHGGYVLDGFPRTMEQARQGYELARSLGITVQAVLHLDVDSGELVRRMSQRAVEGGRSDDTPDVIRHRIEVYDEKTKPLLAYYRQRGVLVDIDGNRAPDEVFDDIVARLDLIADHDEVDLG